MLFIVAAVSSAGGRCAFSRGWIDSAHLVWIHVMGITSQLLSARKQHFRQQRTRSDQLVVGRSKSNSTPLTRAFTLWLLQYVVGVKQWLPALKGSNDTSERWQNHQQEERDRKTGFSLVTLDSLQPVRRPQVNKMNFVLSCFLNLWGCDTQKNTCQALNWWLRWSKRGIMINIIWASLVLHWLPVFNPPPYTHD